MIWQMTPVKGRSTQYPWHFWQLQKNTSFIICQLPAVIFYLLADEKSRDSAGGIVTYQNTSRN